MLSTTVSKVLNGEHQNHSVMHPGSIEGRILRPDQQLCTENQQLDLFVSRAQRTDCMVSSSVAPLVEQR